MSTEFVLRLEDPDNTEQITALEKYKEAVDKVVECEQALRNAISLRAKTLTDLAPFLYVQRKLDR